MQPQSQQGVGGKDTAATGTTSTADQTQLTSLAQASQATTSNTPAQDPNQQANPNSQPQAVSQAAAVTSEQWYQQQQQYQQYYQQYSGYDPHYQQYYPYQQQAVPQYQQQSLQVNASHMAGQHPTYVQTTPQSQPQVQPQPQFQSQVQPQPQAQPLSHTSVQAPVAAQPQNQAQVNQQQQTHLTVPSQTYPTAQGHPQPHVQPFPHAPPHPQVQTVQPLQHGQAPPYQQHHSQMQQPQPQLHPAHLAQPNSQAQPQVQPQPQPQPQPSQSLNTSLMPQIQNPAAHAVTGHQSYPQSQPHQPMHMVTPQHPLHMHAQGGLHSQQQPAEMLNSYSQQPPQMRQPQSHPAIPTQQQQPGLLPVPIPTQQQVHPHSFQPALQAHQRPIIQPPASPMSHQYVQQPLSTQPLGSVQPQVHQQGPFVQQQQSLQSQLPPLGPPHSFHQPPHAHQQPRQTVAGSHTSHPHPSHNLVGRPITPNHGVLPQPYPQSAAGILVNKPMQPGANQLSTYQNNVLKANNQPGVTSQPMSEMLGDHSTDKNVAEQKADSLSQVDKKGSNQLDVASGLGADVGYTNSKFNADFKSVDGKPTGDVGDNSSGFDVSAKETQESRQTFGTDLEPPRDPVSKNIVKGGAIEVQKNVDGGELKIEENKVKDDPLLKTPPLQEAKLGEEQNVKMQKDKILPQDQGIPKGPAGNGFRGIPPSSQVQPGSFMQPSRSVPFVDQERHQPLQMPYGSTINQQRPAASAILQAPPPGLPHNQFRPQVPGLVPHPGQTLLPPENLAPGSFGRGPSNYGPRGPHNQGPHNQGPPRIPQGESLVGPAFGTPPLNTFDSHSAPSYGPGGHLVQRRSANMVDYHVDNRRLDPRSSGLDSTSTFPSDRAHHVGDRGQFEDVLKQFPRPSRLDTEPVPKFGSYSSRPVERGPHGFGMDMGLRAHEKEPHGLNVNPMSGPSRFMPPFHPDDARERPVALPEDNLGRPDFPGNVPGHGRHRMGGFVSRSPSREYRGISPHGFVRHPGDDIDGRERPFNDRFSGFPGHLHRGGFEMAEHLRSHDIPPPHFRKGEYLGHHNMPGHLQMGEPIGFGDVPGHERMGEFGRPGNFHHPRLGEPGFRSSFSLREFPNDGGIYTVKCWF